MKFIKKTLDFMCLLSDSNTISITNLALYVILVKIAISPFDWTAAAALIPVLANYMHRRSEDNKMEQSLPNAQITAVSETIKEVIDKV